MNRKDELTIFQSRNHKDLNKHAQVGQRPSNIRILLIPVSIALVEATSSHICYKALMGPL